MEITPKINIDVDRESTSVLVQALTDTFSVVTEPLGLLGDYIRLYRLEVAERITRRAYEIARSAGLVLKAPPVKFLAPFLERASSESEPELEDLWARLLVQAGNDYSGRLLAYIDILSKMTHGEAVIIRDLAGDLTKGPAHPFEQNVSGHNSHYAHLIARDVAFDLDHEPAPPEFREITHARGINIEAGDLFRCGKLLWCTIPVRVNEKVFASAVHYSEEFNTRRGAYYGLEGKGLAQIRHDFTPGVQFFGAEVCWVELTALGYDFVRCVNGRRPAYGT